MCVCIASYIIVCYYKVNFFFTTIGSPGIIYVVTATFIIRVQSVNSSRTTHLFLNHVN